MAALRRGMRAPLWILPIILGVVLLLFPQFSNDYSTNQNIQQALILSLLVSGLNLSLGYAGELALGQAASYAAGAYGAAYMSMHGHTDLFLELAVGAGAALVVGVVTGIPGLRLGSWSLAMTSFFLVLLIPDVISIFSTQTGGYNGLSANPATLFGTELLPGGTDLYVVIGVVTLIWFAIMRNIAISRHGTALRVLKQSPVLASSMGISVFRMKLIAYALGAVPAGLAGVLFANLIGYISPTDFGFTLATTVLAASILGGSATVYGALIGGFILQFGLNATASYQQYSLVVTGAFLVLGGVLLSGGLIGLARDLCSRFGIKLPDLQIPTAKKAVSTEMPELHGARLDVAGVAKAFGGNKALDGVDLVAEPGKVTALIGPNGSGKTTLLNMICGFYKTDAGTIRLGDRALQGKAPYAVARAGVARTFQTPNIPEGLTVLEAVAAGRYTAARVTILEAVLRLPRYRKVRRGDYDEARRMLALVGISDLEAVQANALPLGQRRLLEVARSMVSRPGVLLLDEVASGLDEDEVQRLAEVIGRVRDAGGTVVLVEHNFQLVLSLADDIFALAHGQLMAHGTPEEIENNPRVMSEYLGIDQSAESEPIVLNDLLGDAGTHERTDA